MMNKKETPQFSEAELRALKVLNSACYSPGKKVKAETVVLTVGGKRVGTLQNLVVLSGLPKAGKSTFIQAIISSELNHSELFEIKLTLPANQKTFALFDTESSEFDFYQNIEMIKRMSQKKSLPANFMAFNVREFDPKQILALIRVFIKSNPDLGCLIIDGLLDLLVNYNDEAEAKKLINWIKAITKQRNILLIGIIHNAKSTGKTVGHAGSIIDRYAQSVLSIDYDKETKIRTLSSTYMRSDEEFQPIQVRRTGKELIQVWEVPQPKDVKKPFQPITFTLLQHQQKVSEIFKGSKEKTYKQLLEEIQEIYSVARTKAQKIVIELTEKKLITRKEGGVYQKTLTVI